MYFIFHNGLFFLFGDLTIERDRALIINQILNHANTF